MNERRWDSVAGACGIAYLVFTVLGWFWWGTRGGASLFGSGHGTPFDSIFGPGSVPRLNAPAVVVAHWYAHNRTTAQIGFLFFTLALLPYMCFLGRMRAILASAERGSGTGAGIYSIGATVGVVVPFVYCTFFWAAAYRPATTSPQVVQFAQDIVMLTGPAGCLAWVAMFAAVAIVVLGHGGLPRWLGWLAIPVGLCQFLYVGQGFTDSGAFNGVDGALGAFVPYLSYLIWIATTGTVLIRRASSAVADEPLRPSVAAADADRLLPPRFGVGDAVPGSEPGTVSRAIASGRLWLARRLRLPPHGTSRSGGAIVSRRPSVRRGARSASNG